VHILLYVAISSYYNYFFICRAEKAARAVQPSAGDCGAADASTPTADPVQLSGRRIVNMIELLEQLKSMGDHGPFGCTFDNMVLLREKRVGLKSGFVFLCNMCNIERVVWSEMKKPGEMDVNTSAVSGTITTGGGHAQLEELLSTMNIPTMTDKTFNKYENVIQNGLLLTADIEMKKAAEEEARIAVERGSVDSDGTPLITVVADGSWCKRSYRTNYSSLSGVVSCFLFYL
jgi:hypothetical protein